MKKAILLALMLVLVSCTAEQNPAHSMQIGATKVNLELAITPAEQAKGLMHREYLAEDRGMLFIFEYEQMQSFWMKNTLIPLDMIFIDSDDKIVDIMTAEPCEKEPCKSYTPKAEAKYVLEVNAGFAEKHNIEIGEEAKLNI